MNSTRHFYAELNRFGLTSAIDAGGGGHLFPVNYAASEEIAQRGDLTLRVSYYLFPQTPGKELEDFREWTAKNAMDENRALMKPHGYVLEGGGEFLVWSAGDFENFMAARPEWNEQADGELEEVATHLVLHRWPFRIHATYGETIDHILDVLEKVDGQTPFDGLRWALDHAETIRADQIQRVQRLGGGIAIQNRMSFAGEFFRDRYGAEVAAMAPPIRALLKSGVPLGGGTDATRVSSHNPWLALSWLVNGETAGGTVIYPPANRLSRLEALRLFTEGSAWFSGEEHQKGTLAPGMLADIAVLSEDYFSVPGKDIDGIESVLTIVDGNIVYGAREYAEESPELPPVDPEWSPVAKFGGYESYSEEK